MMNYAVENNLSDLNLTSLVEPSVNHEASMYIVDNLSSITGQARKMVGVDPDKVDDLVQDLIESILRSEERGEGYNSEYSANGNFITVADFVYGRLKLYSKNARYQKGACERHTSTRHSNGKSISTVDFEVLSASSSGDTDFDSMSGIQKAYATAHSYDDGIESVDTMVSLRQDIEFCVSFDEVVGMSFMNLFKNIDIFSTLSFEDGLFDRLRMALKKHDELAEALHNVLAASANDRCAFDAVLAGI